MKSLLVLFLVLSTVFFNVAEGARSEKPFLAVFAQPGAQLWWFMCPSREPDLYYTANDFDEFPKFLKLVKQMSKGRQEVWLDVDCHGGEDGYLYMQYEAFQQKYQDCASMGYIVNEIDRSKVKCDKLLMENCYAEICMENGLNNTQCLEGDQVENTKVYSFTYPIYGVTNCPNISNLVFLQDRYNIKPCFIDLRTVIGKPAAKPDNSPRTINLLRATFSILASYGT